MRAKGSVASMIGVLAIGLASLLAGVFVGALMGPEVYRRHLTQRLLERALEVPSPVSRRPRR